MNYRHIYHAGNFADVLKHAVLAETVRRLLEKPAPFFALDTHAGIGIYDLEDERAQKTAEAQAGILKLMAEAESLPEAFAPYLSALGKLSSRYPGSPRILRRLMRTEDRLALCELHPEDFGTLKTHFAQDRNTSVQQMDGWKGIAAFLPPKEKRGLMLIDPPFEQPGELDRMAQAAIAAHKRWPQGIQILWYPIKDMAAIWNFHETLAQSGIPGSILALNLMLHAPKDTAHLNGCGLVIINPPWQAEVAYAEILAACARLFADSDAPASRLSWISPAL
ncbi:MAG TPA: 23S rRNA (adenine(2030)-N(6))-methyltransferase RlmJ [Rhodospirillaceae bacterium]|nr:MAG: hypothetical protein A2018_03545 [Alphaproteobacteria bacterium GWF2_58_20]HAU29642.1 23S rRNA (adenine(2030)-N(6))-methyltransferase RlmJ [Rhodospirillaceae bacterium]